MSKTTVYLWFIMIVFPCIVTADELYFPNTEAEIVDALSNEITKTISTPNGVKYVAEKGRVYKIINGKRYTLRGIQVVEALDVLPKAGALINFDFDSAKINADSFPLLDEFGKALKTGLPDSVILISGHTDSKGSYEYNQNLSKLRAEAVVDYLKGYHGINPKRLLTKGFGETQPIAENNTEANRFKNRRVEFVRIK
jgi:outer membrane protein OmpA-like peptidoglycan-associated protein